MGVLSGLEPARVFHYFEEICGIPHGSYNEKAISNYLVEYAKKQELEYIQDELYNVIMFVPASEGYEKEEPIIIQGHMDMVCEKRPDVSLDMEKEPISLVVDGDYVRADGTTLGGDDGIAIAYMLAIAEDRTIPHPALEYIITVSEEVGMDGAAGIDLSMLKGNRMLNIDSEEEGIFLTSCAGGVSAHVNVPVIWAVPRKEPVYVLKVSGLMGGHSGVEIDKERANSNKVIARILSALKEKVNYQLYALEGGAKDNAIAAYAEAKLGFLADEETSAYQVVEQMNQILQTEYAVSDPDIVVTLERFKDEISNKRILDEESLQKVLTFLMIVPNGVQAMSLAVPGLVETSLNVGIMKLNEDGLFTQHAVRSSVTSRKYYVIEQMTNLVKSLGGKLICKGEYPAWEYKQESAVRDRVIALYKEMYQKEPVMEGIHAGLECGLLASKIESLDCISMGPDIIDIHTPVERLSIASTKRVYDFILAFLKQR